MSVSRSLKNCTTSRKVAGSIHRWCHWNFSLTYSFRPHDGPGVDSASNRNEYQEYFLGGKGGRCVGLTTLPPSCADCFEIWDPQPPGTLRACPGLLAIWAAGKVTMLTCQPIAACCALCSDVLWIGTRVFSLRPPPPCLQHDLSALTLEASGIRAPSVHHYQTTRRHPPYTIMRRITTFRSTTDRIYDNGPIILQYLSLCYSCLQYSVQ